MFSGCSAAALVVVVAFVVVIVVCSPSVYFGSKFCRSARRQLPFWWCQAEAASKPKHTHTHTLTLSHVNTHSHDYSDGQRAQINVAFRIFTPFSRGTLSLSLKSVVCFRHFFVDIFAHLNLTHSDWDTHTLALSLPFIPVVGVAVVVVAPLSTVNRCRFPLYKQFIHL